MQLSNVPVAVHSPMGDTTGTISLHCLLPRKYFVSDRRTSVMMLNLDGYGDACGNCLPLGKRWGGRVQAVSVPAKVPCSTGPEQSAVVSFFYILHTRFVYTCVVFVSQPPWICPYSPYCDLRHVIVVFWGHRHVMVVFWAAGVALRARCKFWYLFCISCFWKRVYQMRIT